MVAVLGEILFVVGTITTAYHAAWLYFKEGLFGDRDIKSPAAAFGGRLTAFPLKAAGRAFAATLALGAFILQLIIFEVAGVLRPATRARCWRASLFIMALDVHVVLPFLLAYAGISYRFGARPWVATVAALAVLLFALVSWRFEEALQGGSDDVDGVGPGRPGPRSSSGGSGSRESGISESPLMAEIQQHFLSLEASLSRIGVVGVASLAILSGFGAVNFPFQQLSTLFARVTPAGIAARERQLRGILSLIGKKRAAEADPRRSAGGTRAAMAAAATAMAPRRMVTGHALIGSAGAQAQQWWGSRLLRKGWRSGSQLDLAAAERTAESAGLEQLAQDMAQELVHMREALAAQREARTPQGRLFVALGVFMLFYCGFKLAGTARNVLTGRNGQDQPEDPVTAWMAFLLARWGLLGQVDVRLWSEAASFVLVGVLVVLQTRGFLLTVLKVFRSSSVTGAAIPAQVLSLLLALFAGIYMTSSVLLLRTNVPDHHRVAITHALGDIKFSFYGRWFDSIFLVSGCGTLLYLVASGQATRRLRQDRVLTESSVDFGARSGHAD